MSGFTDCLPVRYSSASDDDSDYEVVPTPKAKPGRKRAVVKATTSSSSTRPARGKGKTGRNATKGKRPLAALEEDLFDDDEAATMTKPPNKRINKKTTPNDTSEDDDPRSTKSTRENKKTPSKKRPTPQHDSSDDEDVESVMIDDGTKTKKRKSQVSDNSDTFYDLSPKTPKFASVPTFSCFIGSGMWVKSSFWRDTPYFTIRHFVDREGKLPGKGVTLKYEYLDIVINALEKMRQHYAVLTQK